ncbi:phage major capsid protein [Weizmannia sp. CD-2023]|uniref:major capsid protein n=1 Tax=Heyndrickxia TaxID=2837504 RepID=UPI002E20DA61|nr:phage major capsid protein [Weizmannia sp. CD-2023]MED4899717.1 phage major capsid protein [Weizmannia sp. CD-2023]
MALTLQEAAKYSTDTLQRGVIETFARTSAVLELLPFMEIAGNAYRYNQEEALPGIAFRGVNEGYTESTGVINPQSEGLVILGGDSDVDRFLVQTRGNLQDIRAIQTEMKAKALALEFTRAFFKGDTAVDSKAFDGLEKRIRGSQLIYADGAGQAGVAFTKGNTEGKSPDDVTFLEKLDELIDAVEGEPDVLFMSKAMRRKVKGILQRSEHYVENGADAFGRPVMTYAGIPIRVIETDVEGNEILGFNETVGADTDTGSIYAVRFGAEQYVAGLRNGGVNVRDLGEIDEKPVYRTRIEFYCGLAVFHPKAVARLAGIKK